ncbi:uncharacterized protein LOC129573902 [Sitodiplosis mosellana]|uniref:uncharacterized protein LOC129573902 n=1 Tax=Sitodiplosis mosellana TaxID=263140 RepID=UPI002443EFF5|nr:uncharacterized protein LOC129573902 [Sitodiplosis mosellana]
MNTTAEQQSQIGDEEIEGLVRSFSQYREVNSQAVFDPESQSFVIESQIDESEAPVKLDYQAEFLKCMGLNETDIEQYTSKAKLNHEVSTQHELNSQTDAEANIRTFMTGNPYWNQNITAKPLDLAAFLENREYFVAIKTGTNNEPIQPVGVSGGETVRGNNNRHCRIFTLGPLPLDIEDILKIVIDCDEAQVWRSYQKIYGQNFKMVMLYGRCKPFGGSINSQKGRNVKLYEVDDGSGMVVVHFPHYDSKYSALTDGINRMLEEYALVQREGIAFLGTSHYGPRTARCKKMLSNLNIILNMIRQNGSIKQEFFTHGCKVCVIGRVFRHSDGTNHVFAYDMIEDAGMNRDFEIKFKLHLLDVYKTKYLKYQITGEPLETTRARSNNF